MGKWLRRYTLEREALRRRVFDTKYGSIWWGWCSNIVQGPYEVFLWKSIRKGWDTFHYFVSFKARDGSSIKFWQDHWCGGHPPKENFPELYSIEHNKDDSVQSFYLSQGIATIGISVLTKQIKIGSWNRLSLLWIYYILECGGGMEWTSCAGNYHPRGCLKLDPIIKSYHPLLMSFSWKIVWK